MRRSSRTLARESPTLDRKSPTAAVVSDVRALLANAEFVKILIGFGVGLAFFNAMLTDLSQALLQRL